MSTNSDSSPRDNHSAGDPTEANVRTIIEDALKAQLEPLLDVIADLLEEQRNIGVDRLLNGRQVAGLLGINERTLRRRVAAREFPSPILVGKRAKRWPQKLVTEWMQARQKN